MLGILLADVQFQQNFVFYTVNRIVVAVFVLLRMHLFRLLGSSNFYDSFDNGQCAV